MTDLLHEKIGEIAGREPLLSVIALREGTVLFLTMRGEVDMHTIGVLEDAITVGLAGGVCTDLVADMSETPFVDSTGYGVFLGAMQTLRMRGSGRVYLAACQPAVARMIQVARLNRVFAVCDSVAAAREALAALG